MGVDNYISVKTNKYFFKTDVGHAVSIYPYKEEIEEKLKDFLKDYIN